MEAVPAAEMATAAAEMAEMMAPAKMTRSAEMATHPAEVAAAKVAAAEVRATEVRAAHVAHPPEVAHAAEMTAAPEMAAPAAAKAASICGFGQTEHGGQHAGRKRYREMFEPHVRPSIIFNKLGLGYIKQKPCFRSDMRVK